nr:adenosylcobinamide-GDP ribazoletransferase [Euzebyales bacterium]
MKQPDYGPRGYLPERAAKRARKIVLREQMGPAWPLAAVAAALLVGATGLWYLVTAGRPPGPPYTPLA